MSLALRSLGSGRGRLVGNVVGVSVAVVLVLFLAAVFHGFDVAAAGIVETSGADVWVGQEDSLDMFHSVSRIPRTLDSRILGIPGVASVAPLYARRAPAHLFHEEGPSADLYVVGFDASLRLGGPASLTAGTAAVGREEVVVTRALVQAEGVGIGDRVHILDRTFTIAGISDTATTGAFSFAFVDAEVARDMFHYGDVASYLLVVVDPGTDADAVAAAIEERAGGNVVALPTPAFAEENGAAMRKALDPILLTITALAFAVGLAVVAITTWSVVTERITDFGVLKALGADDGDLYRVVLAEASVYGLAGYAVALPAYFLLVAFVDRAVATVPVATDATSVALALPVVLAMAFLASWLPVRRVARIDPADAVRRG